EVARCYNGLSYLLAFVCVLFLAMPMAVWGQTKEYATVTPSSGRNSATLGGPYSSTSNSSIADVESPGNVADADENTHAVLKARSIGIDLGLITVTYTGEAWSQMNFPSAVPANTTTYVKIDAPEQRGLGIDLLNIVGGLLGLLSENLIIPEVY